MDYKNSKKRITGYMKLAGTFVLSALIALTGAKNLANKKNPANKKTTPTPIESTQGTEKTTFHFSREQLKALAAVAFSEQNSKEGAATVLKILQNIFENDNGGTYENETGEIGFYNFVKYGNWLPDVSEYIDTGHLAMFAGGGPVTDEMIDVAEAVLNEGIGIVPDYVNEMDSTIDIDSAFKPIYDENGKLDDWEEITSDFSQYKPGETRIKNIYGNEYTFYGFLKSGSEITSVLGYPKTIAPLENSCASYKDLTKYLYLKKLQDQYNHDTQDKLKNFQKETPTPKVADSNDFER